MSFLCTYSLFAAFLFSHFVTSSSSATAATIPTPLSIPPSQYWDGSDGPWSSFELRVGTPPQSVRVLISTASNQPWVVLPEGCASCNLSDCPEKRGGVFYTNQSTTWTQNNASSNGVFTLAVDADLGLHGSGYYGYDSVALGYHGSGMPVVDAQVVSGITTDTLYTGYFGLNPAATNFSSDGIPAPSYMSALKTQSLIPSISYGYTAGNQYRSGKTPGSLTIGGFDASLIEPNELYLPISLKDGFQLSLVVKSISLSSKEANSSLTTSSTPAVIDSTVPFLYLPKDVCQKFEEAFGISYDQSTELYLVNDTLHQQLLQKNAGIVLTLTNSSEEVMVDVGLPYKAFDLIAEYPLVKNSTRYFPIKRSSNSSQMTLGRTFLQEAYIIADYERSNFSVYQRKWDERAQENIQTILPSSSTPSSAEQPSTTRANVTLPVVIAASIGSAVFITILIGCSILICQRRKYLKKSFSDSASDSEKLTRPRITIVHPSTLAYSSEPHTATSSNPGPEPTSQQVSPISPATDCGPYCFQSLATQMQDGFPPYHGHHHDHSHGHHHGHYHHHHGHTNPNQDHSQTHLLNFFPLPPATATAPTATSTPTQTSQFPSFPAQIYELPTRTGSPIRELQGSPVEHETARLFDRARDVERALIRDAQHQRREALLATTSAAAEEKGQSQGQSQGHGRGVDRESGCGDWNWNWDGRRNASRSGNGPRNMNGKKTRRHKHKNESSRNWYGNEVVNGSGSGSPSRSANAGANDAGKNMRRTVEEPRPWI